MLRALSILASLAAAGTIAGCGSPESHPSTSPHQDARAVAAGPAQSSHAGSAGGGSAPHLRASGVAQRAALGVSQASSPSTDPAGAAPGIHPIVALGDSITFGYGTGAAASPYAPPPAHSYPWYLQRELGLPVVNAGISGSTAHDVLDPASEAGHPRPAELELPALLALRPSLMIVGFGSNEAVRGWPISRAATDLSELLGRIAAAHVPIVLFGTHVDCLTMPCPVPAPGYVRRTYTWEWDAALGRLASRYGAQLVLDVENGFSQADLTDWIHPSASGYELVARRLRPAVAAALRPSRAASGESAGGNGAPAGGGAPAADGAPAGGTDQPVDGQDPGRPGRLWDGRGGARPDQPVQVVDPPPPLTA